jgi:hypothetical protein
MSRINTPLGTQAQALTSRLDLDDDRLHAQALTGGTGDRAVAYAAPPSDVLHMADRWKVEFVEWVRR